MRVIKFHGFCLNPSIFKVVYDVNVHIEVASLPLAAAAHRNVSNSFWNLYHNSLYSFIYEMIMMMLEG